MFTIQFLRDALERALSTAAQSAILAIGADKIDAINADWRTVVGFTLGGALLSVLKAVAAGRLVGSNDSASLDPTV